MGNKDTRKAGGYVKELCRMLLWALEWQEKNAKETLLVNFTMNPAPSIQEYVHTACKVAGIRRRVPSLPYPIVFMGAVLIDMVARPLNMKHPFSPVRIRKLVRSNNIRPAFLEEAGYEFNYTLEEAFEDWKREKQKDWGFGKGEASG